MIKWALRVLLVVLAIVAGLVGYVFAFAPTIDLTDHREFISRHASESAGRTVKLGGDVALTLGRHTRLQAGSLRIENPEWADNAYLLAAESLDVGIDLFALTSRVLHIEALHADDVAVAVEWHEDGRKSWSFGDEPSERVNVTPKPDRVRIVLGEASIDGLVMSYMGPERIEPVTLQVTRLEQYADGEDIVLTINGVINRSALRIKSRVGTLDNLLAGDYVGANLVASLGDARFELAGSIGDLSSLEAIDLRASLKSPELATLITDLGYAYPIAGNADLILRVDDADPGTDVRMTGNLGEHQVDVSGEIASLLDLDGIDARFDIHGPDLAALGQLAGVVGLTQEPYRLTGSVEHAAARVTFEQVELRSGKSSMTLHGSLPEFPALSNASVDFDLALEDATRFTRLIPGAPVLEGPLSLKASIETPPDANAQVDASAEWRDTKVNVKGQIGQQPDYRGTALAVELAGPDLNMLMTLADIDGDMPGAFEMVGNLGIGDSGQVDLDLKASRIGKHDIEAKGSLGQWPRLDDLDIAIGLRGPSLAAAMAPFVDIDLPKRAFDIKARVVGEVGSPMLRQVNARVGETRLQASGSVAPLPPFTGTDTQFELSAPSLTDWVPDQASAAWAAQAYRAEGRLRKTGRTLRLMGVTLDGGGAAWNVDASVGEALTLSTVTLKAKTRGADLRPFLSGVEGFEPEEGPFELVVDLAGARDHVLLREARLQWADAELIAKGQVALNAPHSDSEIQVDLDVPDLSRFGKIGGMTLAAQPLGYSAKLTLLTEGVRAREVVVDIGGGSINGEFEFNPEPRPRVNLQATVKGVNFEPFLDAQRVDNDEADRATVASDARLIPDVELPVDLLRSFDAKLRLRGEGIHYPDPGFPGKSLFRDLTLDADLEQGVLIVTKLLADGDHGDLEANAILDASGPVPSVDAAIETKAFRVGLFAGEGGLADLPSNEIKLHFGGEGGTLRDLLAEANGQLRVVGGSGKTRNKGLDQKLGDFGSEVFETVNPFATRETNTQIDCMAVASTISNGQLYLIPGLAMRTDRIDITASGTIDLRSEAVDLNFQNAPRRGIGVSMAGLVRPYIAIRGSLASPTLNLDTSGALVSGTAAVATAGVTVVLGAILDRASTRTSPCERVIAAADENRELRSLNPLDTLSSSLRRQSRESRSSQRARSSSNQDVQSIVE